ncbi:CpXC domain-containing protein [Catenisphaera adipataccumulans]|uniref:CpXC domain-containing protein n=1 Tax=Catenisphaera adipataccumulans TaxID=700500 RepID=A0A7W8CYQ0_9FIRM|nr:CpXC domain-containing protein [Catenisphaera adipataccumulans]MBB5182853.1 hypothetical protein [Catenisphaera adipataccumulans]
MKERIIPSACPHCGHVFQIKRDTMAVAGMNPIIDQRLYDGTYFTHACSQCHHLYYLEQPFLYHDPDRKYILLLTEKKNVGPLPEDELIVRCTNALQLMHAYRILSQGLNISYVLRRQHVLELQVGPVEFDTWNAETRCLWFRQDDQPVAVRIPEEELPALLRRV